MRVPQKLVAKHGPTLRELGLLFLTHAKALLAGALFGLLGVLTEALSIARIPAYVWFALFAICVVWAFYQAFYDVRAERDVALGRFSSELQTLSLQFGTELR